MSAEPVKPNEPDAARRTYRSSSRAERAADTRRRILDSAEQLFLERGFAGTTTKAIAASAGVVEKTVFLTFPGKAALLSELIRLRVRGDHPDARARDSDPWRALRSVSSAEDLFARAAKLAREVLERTARLVLVAEAAALSDAELAARRDLGHTSARATLGVVVEQLVARGLVDAAAAERAKDALFALASEAVYVRLTEDCGWTSDEYERWLARTAAAAIAAA